MLDRDLAANLEIEFGKYTSEDYVVRFYLPAFAVSAIARAIRASREFSILDGEDDVWETFDGRVAGRWVGLAVNYGDNTKEAPYFEISGECNFDGDDAFDYTKVADELPLSDRLVVAAIARRFFAEVAQ